MKNISRNINTIGLKTFDHKHSDVIHLFTRFTRFMNNEYDYRRFFQKTTINHWIRNVTITYLTNKRYF